MKTVAITALGAQLVVVLSHMSRSDTLRVVRRVVPANGREDAAVRAALAKYLGG